MNVAYSVEIKRVDAATAPPYTDGCPGCVDPEFIFAPVVLFVADDRAEAIYRHRACGSEWSCCWALWPDAVVDQ